MRRGLLRAAVVGASTVALIALMGGALVGYRASGITPRAAVAQVPTTPSMTPTTCVPIGYPVHPPTRRVVTIDSPSTITVGEADNGAEYDVRVGTVLKVQLGGEILDGACGNPDWQALAAAPSSVLRLVDGTSTTEGPVAAASFEVVGPASGSITSALPGCAGGTCSWSVSVRATPADRTLAISATSGPPGTLLSIGGQGCASPGDDPNTIDVVVNLTTIDRTTGFAYADVVPRLDGSWTATLTVPPTADPSIGYLVNADCVRDGDMLLFGYESTAFQVTAFQVTELPRTS